MKGTNKTPVPSSQLERWHRKGTTMDMDHVGFAGRLELGLRAKQLKQADIARKAGVSRQILSQVKAGEKTAHRVVQVAADALGCTVEWLTTGTGQAPSWATIARDAGASYDGAPPWALRMLAELQSLRAEVAALRAAAPRAAAVGTDPADEIAAIMDPDEHPRPQAPTYPRPHPIPAPAPGAADHSR